MSGNSEAKEKLLDGSYDAPNTHAGSLNGEHPESLELSSAEKPADKAAAAPVRDNGKALLISFVLMIVIGLGNKIFGILLYKPMLNYPLFVNLLTTFAYLPTSLLYIIPMAKYRPDIITPEARAVPQRVWLIMGTLDSIAGVMQSFGTAYLSDQGALVVLLLQSAIPISMIITKIFLKTKYRIYQYIGAVVVVAGILIVLVPQLVSQQGGNASQTGIWSAVLILSCIPMCLSSVYKEKALGDTEIDAIYMNYWVAVYQFLVSFPLLIPMGYASQPVVPVTQLPSNLWNGMRCYVGINSIMDGSQPDDCTMGPVFVNVYILFNLGYNVLIILLLKYGSANILWLCLTLQVPIANLAFALPFMPNSSPVSWEGGVGLVVIMAGLVVYRFYKQAAEVVAKRCFGGKGAPAAVTDEAGGALLAPGTAAGDDSGSGLVDASGLAVGSESPSAVGGSTPIRGMFTHVTRSHAKGANATAKRAEAVAAARQKVAGGATAPSAGGRARGGSS